MTDERTEWATLRAALEAHLGRRSDLGLPRVARPAAPAPAAPRADPPGVSAAVAVAPGGVAAHGAGTAPARGTAVRLAPQPAAGPTPGPAGPGAERQRTVALACTDLGQLRAAVAACRACPLAETRTQTVFCDGPERARVLFVGEAPGQHEDEQGLPFVGAAGRLLTDIIEKGMGLTRAEVHIANVLKCRPPGNRDPEASEKALCTPFLDRQIELVDPEVLIPLGLHAAQHLLGSSLPMRQLRGRVHAWKAPGGKARKVVPTYHPAYLLRDATKKKDCWQDIQLAMRELGLSPPGRP